VHLVGRGGLLAVIDNDTHPKEAPVSYRLQVTVPDDLADELERRGRAGGQPASRVAAQLLGLAVSGGIDHRRRTPPREVRDEGSHVAQRPPAWLVPPSRLHREPWRRELWTAVLALHQRYGDALSNLPADWWRDPALTEVLGALVTWRAIIDVHGSDPREELAFHTQLIAFGQLLDQRPGGSDVFNESGPSAEWLLGELP
jgi:hypothetical protein